MTDKVDFDKYTDNYNELLREGTRFFSTSEEYFARYKVDLVRNMITGQVRRVLEYGCGIGRNIRYLQKAFPSAEVIGTDISEASLSIAAKENADARFALESTDLNIGKFDLVFVAGVFHHIPSDERASAISLLLRRIEPTGCICVFEHNPYNPVTRRIVDSCPYDADAVLLKPRELRGLFEDSGARVLGSSYCLFIPPSMSWLSPLEKHLGWLPLGGQYWVAAGAG
jgi:SAM-dependent methyltransferase